MRTILYFLASLTASTAVADPMPPIDPGSVPPACAALAQVPASATVPQPAIEARIAVASCGATVRFNALHLTSGDAAVAALADAAKPSLDLLDAAIQQNDPVWTPVAKRAKADLYLGMVVRARSAIPAITATTVGAALAEHDQAHAALEPKIKAWLDQAN